MTYDEHQQVREDGALLDVMLRVHIGAWLVFAIVHAAMARPFAAATHLIVVSATAGCGYVLRTRPEAWRSTAHAVAAVSTLGVVGTTALSAGLIGPAWWYLGLVPLFVGNVLGTRATVAWTAVLIAGVIGVSLAPLPPPENVPTTAERALAGALFAITAAAFVLAARRRSAEQIDTITARERTIAEQTLALAEARDQFEDARDRAIAASRAKTEFLATMSHELRTPLNGILGLGAVLLESRLDRDQRELVATLVASAESQRRLLDDALDLARIESGRLDLAPEAFAVRDCIDDVADLFSGRASEKGVELTVVLDPSVPAVVRGDALRVRQVISNLVGNAVKFTDEGSVVIRARALDEDLVAGGRTTLEVVVEDTGPGLRKEHVGLLFRAFEQVDTNFARMRGGSGLGLAIGRHVARAMGGDLEVDSEHGRGSRFVFRWPVDVIERGALTPSLDGTAVVLVDPSAPSRESFAALTRAAGVRAETVGTAQEAAAMVRHIAPVCVVVASSPRWDACETARELRRELELSCPPMVVAVPPAQVAAARDWVSSGTFEGSMLRPLRRSRLLAVLDDFVGRAAEEPAPEAPAPRSTVRALVVDDDATNRKVARLLLARHGWDVTEASSGEDALVALSGARFDVAFLDLHMPQMDGVQLAARIGATMDPLTAPFLVALTASVFADDHARARQAGMRELLPKPIDLRVLASLVERLERYARKRAAGTDAFQSSLPPPGDDRLVRAKLLVVPDLHGASAADRATTMPAAAPPAALAFDAAPSGSSSRSHDAPRPSDAPDLAHDAITQLREVLGGDDAGRSLVTEFLDAARDQVSALEEAVALPDLVAIERTAHRLAGTSGTLGARALSRAARDAERSARERDAAKTRAAVERTVLAFVRVEPRLRAAFAP